MNNENSPYLLCPHCWERVQPLASKCPHCLSDLRTSYGDPVTRIVSIAVTLFIAWAVFDVIFFQ